MLHASCCLLAFYEETFQAWQHKVFVSSVKRSAARISCSSTAARSTSRSRCSSRSCGTRSSVSHITRRWDGL